MKIYNIEESEELEDYEIKDIEKLGADWCVYYYKSGDYEGSGFAVWRKDGKFYYHDMGHCSCYGPTEEMDNVGGFEKLEDIKKFANNYNFGKEVIEEIKERKLQPPPI
jgi:hypothetical protein